MNERKRPPTNNEHVQGRTININANFDILKINEGAAGHTVHDSTGFYHKTSKVSTRNLITFLHLSIYIYTLQFMKTNSYFVKTTDY
jgi:hypothetical protein